MMTRQTYADSFLDGSEDDAKREACGKLIYDFCAKEGLNCPAYSDLEQRERFKSAGRHRVRSLSFVGKAADGRQFAIGYETLVEAAVTL